MRTLICLMTLFALTANAGMIAGPKGGKMLEKDGLLAEFFVNDNRHVEVTLYDAELNPIPPSEQTVSVIAMTESKVVLEMKKTEEGFTSAEALPAGDGYRVVVRIKVSPDSKYRNFRVDYITAMCGGCDLTEYACVCDHAADGSGQAH